MSAFDLIQFQQDVREATQPKAVFDIWNNCCAQYEKKIIGSYEFEEMKEVVFSKLAELEAIRNQIDMVSKA